MSHAPVETVEEDAADLQFPKGSDPDEFVETIAIDHNVVTPSEYLTVKSVVGNVQVLSSDSVYCNACYCVLSEPYITCAECVNVRHRSCLKCFASGAETKTHANTHSYIITHDNVKVFPNSNWSAREERRFLDLISKSGYGNWTVIASALATGRTPQECRDHYLQYYFDGIFLRTCGLTKWPYERLDVPFLYKLNVTDPPRHTLEMVHTKTMAGYRFARGDFDTPYDASAESIVSHLKMDTDWGYEYEDIGKELNCSMFIAYNNRLRERHRRYRIMREHGLILPNRTRSWLAKYSEVLGVQSGKQSTAGRFISFMQLTTGIAFDKIVESLKYEHDLKKFITKLYELRSNGITTYHGGQIFQRLRNQRLSKSRLKPTTNWEWKHLVPSDTHQLNSNGQLIKIDINNLPVKRKSTPLNIIGLPSYEKLTEDERKLCSTIRVIPDAYLAYKNILMAENTKVGYLRLADARRLIKIDVNKTRVMYDFLFEHGYINKPFDK